MDLIKYDMTDIWAVAGDVVAPDSTKIRAGWGVEVVPRQWWNWFENRQDNNLAYLLQKGIPEWDATTEYIINKSYVQRNGVVYKATATSTNSDPVALTSWVKAFVDSTPYLEAIKALAVTPNTQSYIDGTGVAQNAASSDFGRQIGNVVDAAAARTLIAAQVAHANLTGLSSVSGSANNLPYFTGSGNMAVTTFTGFARSLLDDSDAAAMRTTLGVYSTTESDNTLSSGLSTRQPLATNLTNLAALAITTNTIPFYNSSSVLGLTPVTTFGRGFLNLTDALATRGYIAADDASNLTTGTLPLARLPADLTGKNAATATALQTARTIQGVSFNGTANITLSVVDKDSAVGSATLPAGTTAQRTASPVNGQLRYNSDNNEFEGYINGSWGGIGGGTPLFTTLWWPSRTAIPAGYVPADGQLLTRTSYSAAWARINTSDVPKVTDATWLATSTSRGSYSDGNGTTTFRVPDLNGKQAGTLAAPFLRGDGTNSTGVAGQFQGSANLAHYHGFTGPQAFNGQTGGTGSGRYGQVVNTTLDFPYNTLNDGAVESRPVNVTGVFIIKLIGGASDLTQEDASVAVAALDARVSVLSGRNRIINGSASIVQRASVSLTSGVGAFGGPDRFVAVNANAGGAFTQSQGTLVDGSVTKNCVLQTVTSVITDVTGVKNWSGFVQRIEGFNSYDLVGSPVVISFLFKASVTGTYSVALQDSTTSQSYVSTFAATSGVVTKVVVKVPAIPSAAVVPQTSGIGLQVTIGAINAATLQTSSTNTWLSGNYIVASGLANWGLTNGATIAVTDLQLEAGTSATPFERRSYSSELVLCQRYYENSWSPAATVTTSIAGSQRAVATTAYILAASHTPFKVPKRASPTITMYNPNSGAGAQAAEYDVGGTYLGGKSGGAILSNNNGFAVQMNNSAVVNNVYGWHWSSESEL